MKEKDMEKKEIREKQNRGNKILFSITVQLLISLFLFLFVIFPSFTAPTDEHNLVQLEQYLENSSYSDFQKRMITKSAEEAMEKGISSEDTLSIVNGGIKNNTDAYNVKKFLDTAILAKDEGISEKPIINKVKEGLAKNADAREIIKVLDQKVENMKIAKQLIGENRLSNGTEDEMVDILADSLANGVSVNTLTQILKMSSEEGKDWPEIEEVTKELANLGLKAAELGIGNDKVETIFIQALEKGDSLVDVCVNIQDLITAAVAVQVSGSSSKDISTNGIDGGIISSDIPTSTSGGGLTGSVSSPAAPSGESGSSPFSSGGGDKTDNESGSSPFK